LTVSIDTAKGSAAFRTGRLGSIIEALMARIKPESSWFTAVNGKRTAFFVFDLDDVSSIPSIAEALFDDLRAEVNFAPVMSAEDLAKGMQRL
jgi:hypothetical protein